MYASKSDACKVLLFSTDQQSHLGNDDIRVTRVPRLLPRWTAATWSNPRLPCLSQAGRASLPCPESISLVSLTSSDECEESGDPFLCAGCPSDGNVFHGRGFPGRGTGGSWVLQKRFWCHLTSVVRGTLSLSEPHRTFSAPPAAPSAVGSLGLNSSQADPHTCRMPGAKPCSRSVPGARNERSRVPELCAP